MNSLKLYIFSNIYNLIGSKLEICDNKNKRIYCANIRKNIIFIDIIKYGIYKIIVSNYNFNNYYTIFVNKKNSFFILNVDEYKKNIFYLSDLNYQGLKIEKGFIFLNG